MVRGDAVGEWVAMQIGAMYARGQSQAVGLERDGKLAAGIIYEGWNCKSIQCHLAIKGRITREFLHCISWYAFEQLRAHKIIAPVYSDNRQSLRVIPKMGFVEEGRIKDAQPNGDIILFTMTAAQCRYLGGRYRGKVRTAAA